MTMSLYSSASRQSFCLKKQVICWLSSRAEIENTSNTKTDRTRTQTPTLSKISTDGASQSAHPQCNVARPLIIFRKFDCAGLYKFLHPEAVKSAYPAGFYGEIQ